MSLCWRLGREHKGSVVVVLGGQLRSGSHVNEILDLRQGQQQRFSLFLFSLIAFYSNTPHHHLLHFSFRPSLHCAPLPVSLPCPLSLRELCIWRGNQVTTIFFFFKMYFLLITYYPSEHGIHVNTQEES